MANHSKGSQVSKTLHNLIQARRPPLIQPLKHLFQRAKDSNHQVSNDYKFTSEFIYFID
jgi:hypothetical protein